MKRQSGCQKKRQSEGKKQAEMYFNLYIEKANGEVITQSNTMTNHGTVTLQQHEPSTSIL